MTALRISVPADPGLRPALTEALATEIAAGQVELVDWEIDGPAPCERIDIIIPPYWGGAKRLARIAEVETQLVQWQSIGYNQLPGNVPAGVPVANAATVHEGGTAELAIGLALASQRGIAEFVRDGMHHVWDLRKMPSLADRHVLIIGYGGIGKQIEARLAGFEIGSLTRVATGSRTDRNLAGQEVQVHGINELAELLPHAEVVFLAVPLTPATQGLIDAAALAALPDGALLVNVARGKVVVTDALVAELQAGRLRAAMDVTDPEPLPANHPLWDCEGAVITPHVGGDSSAMLSRITALIVRQVRHLLAGEEPENLVLPAK